MSQLEGRLVEKNCELLAAAGGNLAVMVAITATVSEQLGHARIKITVDTYGHPRQGTTIALIDRLDLQGANTRTNATYR